MSKNRTSIFHQERRESVTKPTGSQLLIHTLFPPAAPPPLCGRAQPVGYSAQATGFRVLIKSNHPNQLDCKYASKPQRAHAGSLRNGIKIGRGSSFTSARKRHKHRTRVAQLPSENGVKHPAPPVLVKLARQNRTMAKRKAKDTRARVTFGRRRSCPRRPQTAKNPLLRAPPPHKIALGRGWVQTTATCRWRDGQT